MRKNHSGRIVQIGSRSDFRPLPSLAAYAASKFALVGALMTIPATHGQRNIKVSIIEPGPADTNMDEYANLVLDLTKANPFFAMFERADLLGRSTRAQPTLEIAEFVKRAIEDEHPQFRYQTTKQIKEQARTFLADPTGRSEVEAISRILQPAEVVDS